MSENKTLSLGFNAKITPIEKLNDQFVVAKCYIHGLGKNRNLSSFSKENVLRNLNTIFNIPVVGHVIECEDGARYMGSHDVEMQLTEDGISFKNLTVPFGVVPMQGEDTLYFEDVVEPSGKTVTYLVGKVLLWVKRYPELLGCIYSDDFYFNESMEIDWERAKTLEDDDNYLDIIDYTYSALCLLGKSSDPEKHSEPCFPCSRVEPYKFALNKIEFSEMMSELKNELVFCFENIRKQKGGKDRLNNKRLNEILAEYDIKLEDLDFEVDENMSEEDFKAKLDEFLKKKKKCDTEVPEAEVNDVVPEENDEADIAALKAELENAKVTLSELQAEFTEYKDGHTADNAEVAALREFKASRLSEDHKFAIAEKLSEFEDLAENAEFIALKEKADNYENVEDLERECYIIRGKNAPTKFAAKPNKSTAIKLPIGNHRDDDEPYGGLFSFVKKND